MLTQSHAWTQRAEGPIDGGRHVTCYPQIFDATVFERALEGQDLVVYGVGLPEQFVPEKDMLERVNLCGDGKGLPLSSRHKPG